MPGMLVSCSYVTYLPMFLSDERSRSPLYGLLKAKLQRLDTERGFTLIELLVVVVIIGALTAVAVPTYLNQVRRSRLAEVQGSLDIVSTVSEIYRLDNGSFPDDFALIENGTQYLDTDWDNMAPNYQVPEAMAGVGPGFADGMQWVATATPDSAPAYENTQGDALSCVVGVGNDVPESTVKSGCNLNP